MFVPMMMSMQSNNFRWHHQKESYSSYYHLTPDKDGIIEHSLVLKQSQNGAQEASAPVNLTCPFQPVRPLMMIMSVVIRGNGPDGGGGLTPPCGSAVPRTSAKAEPPCLL